jgi:hypothetical protein
MTRHPGEMARHPGEMARHLAEMTGHPGEMARHLAEMTRHPGEMAGHLAEMTGHPGEMARHLAEMTRHPGEMARHLAEMTRHPQPWSGGHCLTTWSQQSRTECRSAEHLRHWPAPSPPASPKLIVLSSRLPSALAATPPPSKTDDLGSDPQPIHASTTAVPAAKPAERVPHDPPPQELSSPFLTSPSHARTCEAETQRTAPRLPAGARLERRCGSCDRTPS